MRICFNVFVCLLVILFLSNCGIGDRPAESGSDADNSRPVVVGGERQIWTKQQANAWYAHQGWLVGANFLPSNAINQLEMWQAESFDTATINRELGWAQSLGMNTMRVFLHDLLHQQDSLGFYQRMDTFLDIASRHKIRPLFVFFDSCWDPFPKTGKQRDPKPYTHNSGWVQSPGQAALKDSSQYPRLEAYVKGTVKRFAEDDRILGWDLWNEPDNMTGAAYEKVEIANKVDYVLVLLKKTFGWARSQHPSQPLTSGIWKGNYPVYDSLDRMQKLQIDESDIISFHSYDSAAKFERLISYLEPYGKPILCTEYMARPNGSTFEGSLPIGKKYNIGMYNWGFVDGKSQTIYPWDSWTKKYNSEPPLWFHDIFRRDGKPYREDEVKVIRSLTATAP
ncbi:1,4-beta-xylanase [Flavihumibacter petaseus]|uniref:Putative glycosidase n=1 Tax=Flavihumibacter petaseus NBRC 106054 TaxID=1220578 RepID=A0A0E9MWS2_9BACT|nr:1,4-beta-xylanase [Flavihumibacter petaseus]GAO41565.1 putative glycosidase [Flavihumibacter petaseus NBRC 106054]